MSVLLDSLTAPPIGTALDPLQRDALADAVRDGLPQARMEAWKYTSLRALERRTFAPSAPVAAFEDATVRALPTPRMVFVNGHFDAGLSDLTTLDAGVSITALSTAPGDPSSHSAPRPVRFEKAGDFFPRLTTALATDGMVIRVSASSGSLTAVHLACVGTHAGADVATHLRHVVELGDGAQIDLVEHVIAAGAHANLSSSTLSIRLGSGARLRHARLQQDSGTATNFARVDVELETDARYERLDLELGAALSRNEVNVTLAGPRASLRCNGVLLGSGRTHLDTRIGIEHVGRDTQCDLLWRGLGADRSRAAFHGGIIIREGADGSEASLSNKNLLLSAQAEIDSQPVLEIYADEVKAAHGATVGQLDPTALFYLRSRGIPADAARALLTSAFCREALSMLDAGPLREFLDAHLDAALVQASVV